MLRLEERHDFTRITCDCGHLAITLENRGRMPDRMLHCGHCGASATTHELREPAHPVSPAAEQPGFVARMRESLFSLGRKRPLFSA